MDGLSYDLIQVREKRAGRSRESLPMFESLDLLLVFFCGCQTGKGAQVSALTSIWILLTRIDPVFARF
jgi:hypothetical protein